MKIITQPISILAYLGLTLLLGLPTAYATPGSLMAVHGGDINVTLQRCGVNLSYANVYIPGLSISAISTQNGETKLLYVPPGNHQVIVEVDGDFFTTIGNVSVTKNKTTELGVKNVCLDADDDGYNESVDCDDQNPTIYPGAVEVCNGIDNDCNGQVDDNEECIDCTDEDHDGYYAQQDCGTAVDCDDSEPAVNPNAAEFCFDNIDNNCNGSTDEDCSTCDINSACDTGLPGACMQGTYNDVCTCVIDNNAINEVCDGIDNDCNGLVDDNVSGNGDLCNSSALGICATGISMCTNGNSVCVSGTPELETCDGFDNDCDGLTDEEGAMGSFVYYADGDSDEFGDESQQVLACSPPAGFVLASGDCNDSDPNANPGEIEVCNDLVDNNCNGFVDENCQDTDGDGTIDINDPDDDNDGIDDSFDPQSLNPDICGDRDGDTCDDCSVGTDNFGPLNDSMPSNDGPDSDNDGNCDAFQPN